MPAPEHLSREVQTDRARQRNQPCDTRKGEHIVLPAVSRPDECDVGGTVYRLAAVAVVPGSQSSK